jgi:hypothetical protein
MGSLSIDILPSANGHDEYDKPVVMNLIDHSIGTDADAPGWSAGELLTSGGPWIVSKLTDRLDDARLVVTIDLGELLLSNSEYLDRVCHFPYSS